MANNRNREHAPSNGFTLLETLVALGIASILIATLIPISRDNLFRIVRIGDQAEALAALENAIAASRFDGATQQIDHDTLSMRMTKRSLPPFAYDKEEKNPWQPVLIKIETRSATGTIISTEVIRLERSAL